MLYSRTVLAALLLFIVLISKAAWDMYGKERESQRQLEAVENELAALVARENLLQDDLTRLRTPEGIEAEIRAQFQVAKPGEQMVVLVEGRNVASEEEVPAQSFMSRFFDLFR
ncbi:MAG TPA: septum formation initiator family protein [Candidatus Paceibacterota bacterium]